MIPFYKMHANGNDFMIIDNNNHITPLPSEATLRRWADRHTGVGFDQLLYLTKAPSSLGVDMSCRIFNASGSEAEQCGHGMACLAQWWCKQRRGEIKTRYRIATSAGISIVQCIDDQRVMVDLGYPVLQPDKIPFLVTQRDVLYSVKLNAHVLCSQYLSEMVDAQRSYFEKLPKTVSALLPIRLADDTTLLVGVLGIGNPHCIVLVPNVDSISVELAQQLSEHWMFPNGSNVEFMQLVDPEYIKVRIYERGVGFNQGCGSGACAAVIFGRLLHCLNPVVHVQFPSGNEVIVRWMHPKAIVQLETATQFVFQGELPSEV